MDSLTNYVEGARIWVSDPDRVWCGARVTKIEPDVLLAETDPDEETGETSTVRIEIKTKGVPHLRNPEILIGKDDLTTLSYLHEPAVLHNLEVRFLQNRAIYTYCGIVLVAINPYEELHIYDSDTIAMYRGKNRGELDPHIYAVAEEAFTKMERDDMNQSIIVSGESGAGKTVSAKYAMRYFATVGGTSQTETQIEKKVLSSSPIMEAIGNAKTTRNDNSSRFGKYIEIDFNKHFHIIGANMRTYLLEKSRVVFQATDERNYHIFYQMCAAESSHPLLKDLLLPSDPDEFHYLNQGENPVIDGVDDEKEFNYTQEAFRLLGFSESDQRNIFQIFAGILQLGNVRIDPGGNRNDSESSSIAQDDQAINKAATLFQVDEEQLRKWLCFRKISTVRETYTKAMNQEAALFARDALSKSLYSHVFDWIVFHVNKALKTSGKTHKFIGVLDIYGFETFEINSFEQFCINYANEKLQQQFNMHVFKLEQEEYVKEGIDWKKIDFYDNQPCIDLIESKLGILDLLDEECRVPKGSDKGWVEKLYSKCTEKWSAHFMKPRLSQTAFIVKHFADDVQYECHGFLDKNRDTVMEEQVEVMKASKNELLASLFVQKVGGAQGKTKVVPTVGPGGGKKDNKKTVGTQFRESLTLLMKTLNSTTPHYIRCIKPNDEKASFQFDPKRGVQQLRACGVLETVRISAAGFPSRWTYHDFFMRYRVLCHSKDVKKKDNRSTCENIIQKHIDVEDKYRFGKSKLFFRAGQVAHMENLRSIRLRQCGIMIQKHVKGYLYRKQYQSMRTAALVVQRWTRGHLARKRVRNLRRTKAAIIIQRYVRGFVKRVQYRKLRDRTVRLQARSRGYLVRKTHLDRVRNVKAVVLQKHVRGWLQRKRYRKTLQEIVLVQSLVRRFLARKQYKNLKIQARSVEHQKKLNQGLENKIISLQQKLTEMKNKNKELMSSAKDVEQITKNMENLKKSEQEGKEAKERTISLEEELERLRKDLEKERSEKMDLANELKRETDIFKEREIALEKELEGLKKDIQEKNQVAEGQIDSQEVMEKLEEEKAALHAEFEHERIAYQKLLNDYNRLESEMEEMRHRMGQDWDDDETMSIASSSMLSEALTEDDSAFGSRSARSSLRLRSADSSHIGLTVELQQKLKEAQKEKEKLEKKLELALSDSKTKGHEQHKQSVDVVRVQELEVENAKMQQDLKKLRDAIADEDGGQAVKEVLDQFDHLEDELSRRREECIQLRTVLANSSLPTPSLLPESESTGSLTTPDADELLTAYETQKSVIARMQEQINEEKDKAKEVKTELKQEIEKLEKTCREQQQVINQTINKGPTNNTEACLQHEITRLTGENFDLREKIENLGDTIKRLKKQLRSYMKKLNEVGATLPDTSPFDDFDPSKQAPPPAHDANANLPVIRKKDHDFLGMFEYKPEQESQIIKALIWDLKPKVASQMLPGLPAYIMFMMIRYTDYINNDNLVRMLIQGSIANIKKVVKRKGANDMELKAMWLSNMLRILHNLKQYSGEKQFQQESSPKQIEQCLRNFDLSEYRRVLSDIALWIYQSLTKLLEEEIQPVLVPAVLEHQAIGGISTSTMSNSDTMPSLTSMTTTAPGLNPPVQIDPREALDKLLKLLSRFHSVLTKHGLDPEVISQIFKQLFYFICAGSLNNLLLRKDMCHWSRGMQIRYNVAQLEQWARDQRIQDDQTKVIDALAPIVQASQLLQARKSDEDVQAICDMCSSLKVTQIIKLLNLYTPADEFEERVAPSFVRKIQNSLQERAAKESEMGQTLLMDTKFSFAVKFPFSPSKIQLDELEIPEFYNNLHTLLKKV